MKKLIPSMILLFVCLQAISQDIQNAEQKQIHFFEKRMNQLDLNEILNNQEKKNVLHSFLELGKISPEKGNTTLFRIAVARNIYDTTKLYCIFKNEFDSILAIKYQAAVKRYQVQHGVSDKQMEFLAPSLYQQTREFRFNYYLSPDNEMERARLDNAVRDKYDPILKFGRYSQNLDLVDLNDEIYRSILDCFVVHKKQYPEKTNKEVFREVVCSIITDSADIYTILKNEIDAESGRKYKTDLVNQCKRYNLSDEQSELISEIVLDNAKQLTLYKYLYKNNPKELDEKIEAAKTNFDWTIQYTLTKQGIKTKLSNYCTILKLAEQLALTQDQVENFLSAGWDLFQKNQVNQIESSRDEQHKIAKAILSHEQYENYLSYHVMDKANSQTQALWKEAERLGLAIELDSVSVYPELFAYELERAKIRERYKIIPEKQEERDELLSHLSANKPKALRKIHAFRSREAAKRQQDKNTGGW